MTEGLKIALTAGLTAIGGVTVFVAGQIIQKWFIDPIQEQRKLAGLTYTTKAYCSKRLGVSYTEKIIILRKMRNSRKRFTILPKSGLQKEVEDCVAYPHKFTRIYKSYLATVFLSFLGLYVKERCFTKLR